MILVLVNCYLRFPYWMYSEDRTMTVSLIFISVPTTELFTIRMHYMIESIEGMASYVDYCSADQISKIELLSMAREFKLDVQDCTIWWHDVNHGNKGLREVKTDLDALSMAMSVDSSKEVYVCIMIKNGVNEQGVGSSRFNDEGTRLGQTSYDKVCNVEEEETEKS